MYRILSPTAILGYGFPQSSFDKAMELKLDLIAADAGSVDAGPYYLGSGRPYMGKAALARDLEIMVKGTIRQGCKMVIGSAGFSGSKPQLEVNVELVKKILLKLGAVGTKLAVIPSDVDPEKLVPLIDDLEPLGNMPPLSEHLIRQSQVVGQMGDEPIKAALDAGAQIVITGRAYDPAVFSADPIRLGYPRGAALHAAKILECGAIACEPGSGSDCLIAELHEDGKTIIYPPNEERKATVRSIAAHTLYEKSRPDIFHLPGGTLSIQNTTFFQEEERKAGFTGSEFIPSAYSIKLEGSVALGHRMISIVPVKNIAKLDPDIHIYGRNGINSRPVAENEEEIGLLVVVRSDEEETAKDALSFLRSTLLHYGYPGRISTAGNLAFPFSPSDIIRQANGQYEALFLVGSRDPFFRKALKTIQSSVMKTFRHQHPGLASRTSVTFIEADRSRPLAVIESICRKPEELYQHHQQAIQSIEKHKNLSRPAFENLEMGQAFSWSIHHLIHDQKLIQEMFPVQIMELTPGLTWNRLAAPTPAYPPLADVSHHHPDLGYGTIEEKPLMDGVEPLTMLASVIRSKNAGINEITYDVMFETEEGYQRALRSGRFTKENLSGLLGLAPELFIGSYRFDPVRAIKFTFHRKGLSGSPGDRDVFGAQQHTPIMGMLI